MAGMKVCPICGKDFYDGSISHTKNTCSIKCRDALYYQSPEKKFKRDVQTRLANMKSQHGIEFDSEAIERIKADLRIGKCLLCGSEENLCIDHDHVTGEYRGLLCQHCNWGIGHANESPSLLGAWIVYLIKNNAHGINWKALARYCMPAELIETVYGAE